MQYQKGISLIETMIVIVIVGILGSIAIPAYNNYVIRAKVTSLIVMAKSAQLAVAESILNNEIIDTAALNDVLLNNATNKGYIEKIALDQTNPLKKKITLTADSKKLGLKDNQTLNLIFTANSDNGILNWECGVMETNVLQYVPGDCRKVPN